MSLSNKKNVSGLVEKFRSKYPYLERPLLRMLIRKENKITNPSELRKLDRCLKKAYKNRDDLASAVKPFLEEYLQWKKDWEQARPTMKAFSEMLDERAQAKGFKNYEEAYKSFEKEKSKNANS